LKKLFGSLENHGIDISMDGKGQWIANVFVERLWRNVKYEDVYLKAYGSIAEARQRPCIKWTGGIFDESSMTSQELPCLYRDNIILQRKHS
jgi:transposase InsO family protein